MHSDEYPRTLFFEKPETVSDVLGSHGFEIPGRTGAYRRSTDDRDWWCFRRWLLTMVSVEQIPSFPFRLSRPVHGQGPDFLLNFPNLNNGGLGVEVTEATCEEDQIERTKGEASSKGHYELGEFGGRSYSTGDRSVVENDYVAHILDALGRKLEKANRYFEFCHSLDILIYVNNNAGTYVELSQVATGLADAIEGRVTASGNAHRMGRIVVLDHSEFGMFMDGKHRLHRTVEAA